MFSGGTTPADAVAIAMTTKHSVVIATAAAALSLLIAVTPRAAEARHHHGWRIRPSVGAIIAGAVVAGAVLDASVNASVRVETAPPVVYYPPPPPPVYAPPPPPVYAPPPPPVYYAPPPPPAPVVYAAPAPRPEYPRLGLVVSGTVQAGRTQELPVGGVAAALQIRTSRHSLLGLELQSVGVHRPSDGTRRNDLDALMYGRVFLWNAALAPYLEVAGGVGKSSVHVGAFESHASQLLGRFGVGLELRLGQHLVLDGQIAQLHRLNMSDDEYNPKTAAFISEHERATEFRGGIGFRF
jgi:hypothetical protein